MEKSIYRIKNSFALFLVLNFANAIAQKTEAMQEYHIIYIDNSKSNEAVSGLSQASIDYIYKKVDSLKSIKNLNVLIYLSDGAKPVYVKSIENSKDILSKLNEGYSTYPNCIEDKMQLMELIARDKLDNVSKVYINYFLTDYYLKEELMKDRVGYLTNFLPYEIQNFTNCKPENLHVNIYYPDNTKSLKKEAVINKLNFNGNNPDFKNNQIIKLIKT